MRPLPKTPGSVNSWVCHLSLNSGARERHQRGHRAPGPESARPVGQTAEPIRKQWAKPAGGAHSAARGCILCPSAAHKRSISRLSSTQMRLLLPLFEKGEGGRLLHFPCASLFLFKLVRLFSKLVSFQIESCGAGRVPRRRNGPGTPPPRESRATRFVSPLANHCNP